MTSRYEDHVLGPDTHANLPAASAVPVGATYSCSTHGLIYRSDGTAWATYAVLVPPGGAAADVLTKVSATDGDVGWAAPAGGGGASTYWAGRVRQTLTDKTSFAGTTAEQWGTEEATAAFVDLPDTAVTVYAEVVGKMFNLSTNASITVTMQISLDGGATWDSGLDLTLRGPGTSATDRNGVVAAHQVTGVATGDVLARAMITSATSGSADARDFLGGVIFMEVASSTPF